jgi:hypothetical protein
MKLTQVVVSRLHPWAPSAHAGSDGPSVGARVGAVGVLFGDVFRLAFVGNPVISKIPFSASIAAVSSASELSTFADFSTAAMDGGQWKSQPPEKESTISERT